MSRLGLVTILTVRASDNLKKHVESEKILDSCECRLISALQKVEQEAFIEMIFKK